jgi:hypothetical protein
VYTPDKESVFLKKYRTKHIIGKKLLIIVCFLDGLFLFTLETIHRHQSASTNGIGLEYNRACVQRV